MPPDSGVLAENMASFRVDSARLTVVNGFESSEVLRAAAMILTESGYHITVSELKAGILSAEKKIIADASSLSMKSKRITRWLAAPLAPEIFPLPLAYAYIQRVSVSARAVNSGDVRVSLVFREKTTDASGSAIYHALLQNPRAYQVFFAQLRQALFRIRGETG